MIKWILRFVSAPVAIAAVLLVGTEPGRKLTRKAIKETVKGATALAEGCKDLFEETEEKGTLLIGKVEETSSRLLDKAKDTTGNLVDRVKESTAELVAEAKAEMKSKRNGETANND